MTNVSGSPPAQGPSQPLHAGVVDNEIENMQPSGAARLFQDEILQAAAAAAEQTPAAVEQMPATAAVAQTTAAAQTTTTGQLGNSATGATVTGQSHEMDVDVPPITVVQNHPPAHIVATVHYGRGRSVRGSTAHEVHPANPHLMWCTKSQHWIHRDLFGDQRTCTACREKERIRNAQNHQIRNEIQHQMQLDDQMPQQQLQQEQPPPPPPPPLLHQQPPQQPPQRRLARSAHSGNPELLWCTAAHHYVNQSVFGEFLTCQRCRDAARARRQRHNAMQHNPVFNQNQNPQSNEPESNQSQPVPEDPPLNLAVTEQEKRMLDDVRKKLMEIKLEVCSLCHEEWFDLKVVDGICYKCKHTVKHSTKYQPSNNMYPGPGPSPNDDLPALTQMEEMLIAPVHALVQLWQVRGGQFKYTGHTCNFPRENAVFHAKVPLLPNECDIIIMRRRGVNDVTNEEIFEDFRVRRDAIEKWLRYLELHHPTFQSQQVTIDYT